MTRRHAAVLAALLLNGCKSEPRQELVVGVVAALTGANAAYGISMRNGIELAIEEANKPRKQKIRMVFADDQSRPEEAGHATQRLVTEEKVRLVLGEASSAPSLEMAPIAQRAEVVMITPSSTDPVVTELGDFIFRVCFVDPFQAEVLADVAREKLKIERVSVLRDVDSNYSVALSNAFTARFTKLGGEIVRDEAYTHADSDFAALLGKIASAGTQAIYVPGYTTELAKIAKVIKQSQTNVRILSADGFDAATFLDRHAAELEGAYFTTHFIGVEPRPEVAAFVAAYRDTFNEMPDAVAALAYDSAKIALAAYDPDPHTFRDALAETKNYPGVTGTISFDEKRNAAKSVVVVAVEGGRRVFIERRSPSPPSSDPPNNP